MLLCLHSKICLVNRDGSINNYTHLQILQIVTQKCVNNIFNKIERRLPQKYVSLLNTDWLKTAPAPVA